MVKSATATANRRPRTSLKIETTVVDNEIVQEVETPMSESENPVSSELPVSEIETQNLGDENPVIGENKEQETTGDILSDLRAELEKQNQTQAQQSQGKPPDARQDTQKPSENNEEQPVSSLDLARLEAAQKVLESSEQGQLQRIRDGIEAGIADIEDFNTGREIGRLLALAKSTENQTNDFSEGLRKLRSHTSGETADVVKQALVGMGFKLTGLPPGEQEKAPTPLMGTVLAGLLPSRDNNPGFRLFEKE